MKKSLSISLRILFDKEDDETVEEATSRFQRLISDLGLKSEIVNISCKTEGDKNEEQ